MGIYRKKTGVATPESDRREAVIKGLRGFLAGPTKPATYISSYDGRVYAWPGEAKRAYAREALANLGQPTDSFFRPLEAAEDTLARLRKELAQEKADGVRQWPDRGW